MNLAIKDIRHGLFRFCPDLFGTWASDDGRAGDDRHLQTALSQMPWPS